MWVLTELPLHYDDVNDDGLPAAQVVPTKTHIWYVDKSKLGIASQVNPNAFVAQVCD